MGAVAALPPGPRLPPLVQTMDFLFGARRYFDACRRRYGDVVWMSTAFDRGFVMVFDPDVVKQVFQAPPDRLRAGEANAVLAPLLRSRAVLRRPGAPRRPSPSPRSSSCSRRTSGSACRRG